MKACLVGIDIGAGSGAKLGVFDARLNLLGETLLPVEDYGATAVGMLDGLAGKAAELLHAAALKANTPVAVGIVAPGIFRSDGTVLGAINLPFLANVNLMNNLADRLHVPVACANDADAGALAEWSRQRTELLYWVFGGGWGGAWVSGTGRIRFPSIDWDGDDSSLHYTNEPGYAIPVPKDALDAILRGAGASFQLFLQVCAHRLGVSPAVLAGPSGRTDCVRAELFLSGPGRWRIFKTLAETDRSFESQVSSVEIDALREPGPAGKVLDDLAGRRVDIALRADKVFGRVLAEAAGIMYRQACQDGCPPDVPIFVAGKPSRALPFFGPAAESAMRDNGLTSCLRPSWFHENNRNPNMLGAALMARELLAGR